VARSHPAWRILALAFVAVVMPAAARGVLSILAVPLESELGWGRWVVSTAAGLSTLLFGLLGPFLAAAVGRFGARRVMLAGLATMAASMALAPVATHPVAFIAVWGGLAGFGSGVLGIVFGAAVVDRWFAARRGLAMGILSAAIATAQLVVLPPAAWLVGLAGWRGGVAVLAAWAAASLLAALRWMRDRPEQLGATPYGAPEAPSGSPPAPTHPQPSHLPPAGAWSAAAESVRVLGRSARRPVFWLLAIPFFVCGLTTGGLIAVHLVPASLEHGMPEMQSALLLSTIGVFDFAGSLLSGWLSDRWHNGRLLAFHYGIRALSLAALPAALDAGTTALVAFALVYGLGWVATVPPTVRLARTFFGADGPAVFGWTYAIHQVGAAVAAAGAGYLRDLSGSYSWAFYAAAVMAAGAVALSLAIRLPSRTPVAVAVGAEPAT
jgi:MFS family permease